MVVEEDIKEIIQNKKLVDCFDKKTILITGASGLIGSMIIRVLDYANQEYGLNIRIVGYARNKAKSEDVLGDIINRIDMIYSSDFSKHIPCHYIIHTASPTSSSYFIEHPVETLDSIFTGTMSMLELARKNNAVFVYLSSMEEYGVPYEAGQLMREDKVGIINHLSSRSCYPTGKRVAECMCAAYTSEYEVDTRIVRLAQTFGAGIPLTDNRVSMQFAKSVVANNDIILHTEGKSISNFCYLSDAIEGILTIAKKGNKGEAYNVCNDAETRSIYEIATLVANDVANGKIKIVKDIPKEKNFGYAPDNTMRLCSDKLRKLGWEPKVGMAEGYKRLVRYLSDNKKELAL